MDETEEESDQDEEEMIIPDDIPEEDKKEGRFLADQYAGTTTVKNSATYGRYWARKVLLRQFDHSKNLEAIEELFNFVANRLSEKGEADAKDIVAKKAEFKKLKDQLAALQADDKKELKEVKRRTEEIIEETNEMVKGLKNWMKSRENLKAAFLAAVKDKCTTLRFYFYQGKPQTRSRKKIYPSWREFIQAMMYDVILLARACNVLPILCIPCWLICFRRRKYFDSENMIDLSKIFRSKRVEDIDQVKLRFAKAIFPNADSNEKRLELFNDLPMPQIALPGSEWAKLKYHKCLKGAEGEINEKKGQKGKDGDINQYELRKDRAIKAPEVIQQDGQGADHLGQKSNILLRQGSFQTHEGEGQPQRGDDKEFDPNARESERGRRKSRSRENSKRKKGNNVVRKGTGTTYKQTKVSFREFSQRMEIDPERLSDKKFASIELTYKQTPAHPVPRPPTIIQLEELENIQFNKRPPTPPT